MATMTVLNSVGGTETVEKPMSVENNALLTSIDGKLTTIDGHVDGLETAIASTNTKLDSVIGFVDGLETAVGATNTALATTNTNLTTIDGRVDGLEALIGATNTALGTVNTSMASTTASPVSLATDSISTSAATLTPKFAKIAISSSGANTVVAAVTSKKIRVLQFWLSGAAAVNAKFQSHVTPTDLSGLVYIAAAGGNISAPFCPVGLFESVSGEALDINLSGAVAVGGSLVYVEV